MNDIYKILLILVNNQNYDIANHYVILSSTCNGASINVLFVSTICPFIII